MKDFALDFEDFGENIWLNAASEGPLPKIAAEKLKESIHWKSLPYKLDIPKFASVVVELKQSLGKLTSLPCREIIIGNSTTYGLHILANGIQWKSGDEILLMENDFPTNILPWLALEKKQVQVKQIPAKNYILSVDELSAQITSKTRLVCLSHVHTFSGHILDVEKIAAICREKHIIFILNVAQSLGNTPLNLNKFNVDGIVGVGYKWLCGPYGTGFCWFNKDLLDQLDYNHAYWISLLSEEDLKSTKALEYRETKSARKYDMFGTTSFFNNVPFTAAIDYWLEVGLQNVHNHNNELIDKIIQDLDKTKYDFISATEKTKRSNLVVISHKDNMRNQEIYESLFSQNIYPAFWKGNIRFSPHAYNSPNQIKIVVNKLNNM